MKEFSQGLSAASLTIIALVLCMMLGKSCAAMPETHRTECSCRCVR